MKEKPPRAARSSPPAASEAPQRAPPSESAALWAGPTPAPARPPSRAPRTTPASAVHALEAARGSFQDTSETALHLLLKCPQDSQEKKALCDRPLSPWLLPPLLALLSHTDLQKCRFIPTWGLLPRLFSLLEDPLPTAPTGTGGETGHEGQIPLLSTKAGDPGPGTYPPWAPGCPLLCWTLGGDVMHVRSTGNTAFWICTPLPKHSTQNTQPWSGLRNNETPSWAPRCSSLPHSQAFAPAVALADTTTGQSKTCPPFPTPVRIHSA